MISKELCEQIWHCHREIATSNELLATMDSIDKENEERRSRQTFAEPKMRDRVLNELQLGFPTGDNGHRLFRVSPVIARSVIKAHIADKQAELVQLNEKAALEVQTPDEATQETASSED